MNQRIPRWQAIAGTVFFVCMVLLTGYLASLQKPKQPRERLPLEIKQQMGLEHVWIEQKGKGRYIGRGVDSKGGDYDLEFRGSYANWSYTAKDKHSGAQRSGEIKWNGSYSDE